MYKFIKHSTINDYCNHWNLSYYYVNLRYFAWSEILLEEVWSCLDSKVSCDLVMLFMHDPMFTFATCSAGVGVIEGRSGINYTEYCYSKLSRAVQSNISNRWQVSTRGKIVEGLQKSTFKYGLLSPEVHDRPDHCLVIHNMLAVVWQIANCINPLEEIINETTCMITLMI